MFAPKPSTNANNLSKRIDDLLIQLTYLDKSSEEYDAMVNTITKLYELKEIDYKITSDRHINVNTFIIASANLAGIVAIVGHERTNIITSKAIGLLMKLK